MITFSEFLADYIRQKALSWKKAAAMCGVDRSALRRYANGENIPRSEGRLAEIAAGLEMSEEETKKWCELYRREKSGADRYEGQMVIDRILREGVRMDSMESMAASIAPISCTDRRGMRITEAEALLGVAKWMLSDTQSCRLRMNLRPVNRSFLALLSEVDAKAGTEQIIDISNADRIDRTARELEAILPLLLAGKNYRILCKYSWSERPKEATKEKSFLLTDRGLLLLDMCCGQGYYTSEKSFCRYYAHLFQREKERSTSYAGSLPEREICVERKETAKEVAGLPLAITYQSGSSEEICIHTCDSLPKGCYIREVRLLHLFGQYIQDQGEREVAECPRFQTA